MVQSLHVEIIGRVARAVTDMSLSKAIVGQGYLLEINVTVENHGQSKAIFNVTIYANTTIIQTREITLTRGTCTLVTFVWNTIGFAKGNYTISAFVHPIPGEVDTADNSVTGWIIVTIPGDVDGDFDVDLYDAVKLLVRYGVREDDPQYNAVYDIDEDGRMFLYDVIILLAHYGQKDP